VFGLLRTERAGVLGIQTVLQTDDHPDVSHPTDCGVRTVGQALGVFLTRLGGLGVVVVRQKLFPFTAEPTLPTGDWRITDEAFLLADATSYGDLYSATVGCWWTCYENDEKPCGF